jgi:hypothetical protein
MNNVSRKLGGTMIEYEMKTRKFGPSTNVSARATRLRLECGKSRQIRSCASINFVLQFVELERSR